ncbi:hypothetical protein NBRC116602_15600 [Hyphomicrobiales bacterium 4NK60-0047b]
MEIFKYIPGIKFREVTASASIYVALGELFALGEVSEFVVNNFRSFSHKIIDYTLGFIPYEIILTVKEKNVLIALLLFSPMGIIGLSRFFKRNKNLLKRNLDEIVGASLLAWLIFLILVINSIVFVEGQQVHPQKEFIHKEYLFLLEYMNYLFPATITLFAIVGIPLGSLFTKQRDKSLFDTLTQRFCGYLMVGFSILCCVMFPLFYSGFTGYALFLILFFILISVHSLPYSFVRISALILFIVSLGYCFDIMKNVISQI